MIVVEYMSKGDIERCKQFFRDNPKRKVIRVKADDKVRVIRKEEIMTRKNAGILGVDVCD